jgi:hypothetical protein
MRMKHNTPVFPSDLFTWSGNEGSTCDSDLPDSTRGNPPDTFFVRSTKTGALRGFGFVKIERDADDDITQWLYSSGDLLITIFND